MSTIWVALIVIAIAMVPAAIFIRLHKQREKKRIENLLVLFANEGAKHNLSFTRQEMLKDKMLGLDVHRQKLLVFPFYKEQETVVIDLADVETCVVYKEYDSVITGDKKAAPAERVLAQTGLNIVFAITAQSLQIEFYDSRTNAIYEIPELEKKAKEWKALMTNIPAKKATKRA